MQQLQECSPREGGLPYNKFMLAAWFPLAMQTSANDTGKRPGTISFQVTNSSPVISGIFRAFGGDGTDRSNFSLRVLKRVPTEFPASHSFPHNYCMTRMEKYSVHITNNYNSSLNSESAVRGGHNQLRLYLDVCRCLRDTNKWFKKRQNAKIVKRPLAPPTDCKITV